MVNFRLEKLLRGQISPSNVVRSPLPFDDAAPPPSSATGPLVSHALCTNANPYSKSSVGLKLSTGKSGREMQKQAAHTMGNDAIISHKINDIFLYQPY